MQCMNGMRVDSQSWHDRLDASKMTDTGKDQCLGGRRCLSFPGGPVVMNLLARAGDAGRREFSPWVGKILWRRKRQPTPVFLPGESQGQRSLAGYSP